MQFGEDAIHEGAGVVVGSDTGRVIAKFSHEAEAEAFCEALNETATLPGVASSAGLGAEVDDEI